MSLVIPKKSLRDLPRDKEEILRWVLCDLNADQYAEVNRIVRQAWRKRLTRETAGLCGG